MQEVLQLQGEKVITLIGAGGKTTTMYHLAKELANVGKRVLITTTTKIFYSRTDAGRFVMATTYPEWLDSLQARAKNGEFLVAGKDVNSGKVIGVDPAWINQLAGTGVFDHILVEGDGSARKSLKVPAAHEPVIPESASIVLPVMGLRVLGKPLSEELVHRAARFSEVTGLQEGEKIRIEHYARAFLSTEGYDLLRLKAARRVAVIINQVDNDWRYNLGQKLGLHFLQDGIELILLTSYRHTPIVRRVFQ